MTRAVIAAHRQETAPDANPRGRPYGEDERRADLVVHVVGLTAATAGAVVLIAAACFRDRAALSALSVYAAALIAMFGASAAYNLGYETRFRAILRRFDHSAIFLMIAGTYTPFTTRLIAGQAALWSTAWIWSMALGGILLKLLTPGLFERISVVMYLALGWFAATIFAPVVPELKGWPLAMLLAGGGLYSSGVYFHLRERLRFHNAIWHAFVLAAASCQYVTVLTAVALR